MSKDQIQLAMTTDWWVTRRDSPHVRDAIVRAFLEHWLPVVEDAIQQNRGQGREPATWDQLAAALDRNFATLWRARNAKVKVSWYDAELIAEVLGLRIEQLTPTRRQWLPVATRLLCRDRVEPAAADAYACYRMTGIRSFNPHLDADALETVLKQLPDFPDVRQLTRAILATAERVGESLQRASDEADH